MAKHAHRGDSCGRPGPAVQRGRAGAVFVEGTRNGVGSWAPQWFPFRSCAENLKTCSIPTPASRRTSSIESIRSVVHSVVAHGVAGQWLSCRGRWPRLPFVARTSARSHPLEHPRPVRRVPLIPGSACLQPAPDVPVRAPAGDPPSNRDEA
jgi:hypothetical protein